MAAWRFAGLSGVCTGAAAGTALGFTTKEGSRSERTWSREMRRVVSSTRAERTISEKGAGSSGRTNWREPSRHGQSLAKRFAEA